MERDRTSGEPQRRGYDADVEATPDSATWDADEDAEIELLGDHEPVDVVDLVDESWAPGQPPPGVPGDEVLHVHRLTERESPADELDLDELVQDRLALAPDEFVEDETE
jgi:hypothetical protein